MKGKKNIMNAIKRPVSPSRQSTAETIRQAPFSETSTETTPFTRYVIDNLNLQDNEHKLLTMTFAPQIQTDCDAKVLDFDDYFHLLGTEKRNTLRVLDRTIEDNELVLLRSEQNSIGRPRDIYLLSVNQLEEVLLAANTEEGKRWRKLVLKIKNLVVNYMKIEMEASARIAQEQLEEQTSKLAIEEAKRQELEAVQTHLQATIEAQKRREDKKEARKKQQKEPLETAYLMTNNADPQRGPFKSGCTARDPKKRAKGMQTGNHEELKVVASVKCMDAELVEKVMHRIFHDYRTNDKLEWFDTNLKSMRSVMKFLVEMIDGLNQVDHDEISISEHLDQITMSMRERVLSLPPHADAETDDIIEEAEQLKNDVHLSDTFPIEDFIEDHLCLGRDKRDPRYHRKATALYNHYVTTIPLGHQALDSNEFFKKTKILLKDHYKNAGSKRDRRYEGIELV